MDPTISTPLRKAAIWFLIAAALVPATLLLRDPSADLYLRAIEADFSIPKRLTEIAMLALIAAFGVVAWGLRRLKADRIATAFTTGIGVIAAYGLSEVIKLIIEQERPCREVVMLDECPAVGDWSFPSNHTVIAFAVATGILIIAANYWALLGYVVATLIGVLRILTGAHYPHDVLAGAILGVCVTVGVYLLLFSVKRAVLARLEPQSQAHDRFGN